MPPYGNVFDKSIRMARENLFRRCCKSAGAPNARALRPAALWNNRRRPGVLTPRMPILPKESDIFPDDLFEMPTAGAPWEIAHLRSRQEKAVARLLLDGRKPFYLPQMKQKKKSSGRTFVSHQPLFPGYIFVRRVQGLRETLWRTSVVANLLEVSDQAQLTAELRQIWKLQASGAVLTPHDELVPGDAVDIQEGVFRGYAGVVVEGRGTLRLIVQVSALRRSVTVEFPRDMLWRQSSTAAARSHN
jgi:transcription antitermination factor NusG